MKVAFVSQPWDTLSAPVMSGSIPIWTYEIAKRLQETCEVVIYARRSEGQAPQEVAEGIEFRRVSTAGTRLCNAGGKAAGSIAQQLRFVTFRYLSSRIYALPYFLRVAADLQLQQCNVVHVHNFSQAVPIIRALNPRIKIVLHMHCEWLTQFSEKVMARRLAQCDLVVGCSDYIAQKVKDAFPQFAGRCVRVYNGVDVAQFERTSTDLAPPELAPSELASPELAPKSSTSASKCASDTQTILFVGRLSPEKGLHTLLSAFEHLSHQHCANAYLQIVGPNKPTTAEFIADLSDDPKVQSLALLDPPNYLQQLKAQISDELAERISFVGQVSHLQLHGYYQQAAVLVNPSLSEAFGMSLVEAMASEVPVVATRVGGMVDVVSEDVCGLLVPADDVEALAKALQQLLADEALRHAMGVKGRERAEEMFAWDVIVSNLLGHYQALNCQALIGEQL